MEKEWIKEFGLRYEGILSENAFIRHECTGRTIYNRAYNQKLWWSTKLKTHVYCSHGFDTITLVGQHRKSGCYIVHARKWRLNNDKTN